MDKLIRYKSMLLELTSDIVLITDNNIDNPSILYVNTAFEKLTGYTKKEVLGQTPRILQGPKTDKSTLRRIKKSLYLKKPIRVELLNYSKAGEEYWLDFSVTPLLDDEGEVRYFAAIERDITEYKRLQNNLIEIATKDPLTDALNRNQLYDIADHFFNIQNRGQLNLAVMVIDLDDFKGVNDTYGHLEGDKQLKLITNICEKQIRKTDYLCRFGGDEFIVLMHGIDSADLKLKADKMIDEVNNHQDTKTSISIGATLARKNDKNIDDLIARADKALYDVKNQGKGKRKVV